MPCRSFFRKRRGFSILEASVSIALLSLSLALCLSQIYRSAEEHGSFVRFEGGALKAYLDSERAAWSCGSGLSSCTVSGFLVPLRPDSPAAAAGDDDQCVARIVSSGEFAYAAKVCAG